MVIRLRYNVYLKITCYIKSLLSVYISPLIYSRYLITSGGLLDFEVSTLWKSLLSVFIFPLIYSRHLITSLGYLDFEGLTLWKSLPSVHILLWSFEGIWLHPEVISTLKVWHCTCCMQSCGKRVALPILDPRLKIWYVLINDALYI